MIQLASPTPFHANPLLSMLENFDQREATIPPTVLLAEDNDLRYVMECSLRAMGYLVIACADAELASLVFRGPSRIDILLTDFEMPGRSGMELARELASLRPSLPVVIITGSTLAETVMKEIQDRRWLCVSKPCHLGSLGVNLQTMLFFSGYLSHKVPPKNRGLNDKMIHRFDVTSFPGSQLNGIEAARQLAEIDPKLHLLQMSRLRRMTGDRPPS